jgi:flagellar L-ring protein precursor FlgH
MMRPAILALAVTLSGCGALQRLSDIGRPPPMTPSTDPTKDPAWRPMTMPSPRPDAVPAESDSLWRSGSRAFFKDQRAAQVGDLLTVEVNVADAAALSNVTSATRTAAENMATPNVLGFEQQIPKFLPKAANPASMVATTSSNSNAGNGAITRSETVTIGLAGVVTQVLPNGNLVVEARQEVRVNSELRELKVTGVVRPQDITSDNTVTHDRMAEARISYGGRGTLTDVQQPRWGQQIMDILLPF